MTKPDSCKDQFSRWVYESGRAIEESVEQTSFVLRAIAAESIEWLRAHSMLY